MLRIRILAIGKDKDRWISEGCDHYLKLLSRYAKIDLDIIPSPKTSSSLTADKIKALEADRLEKKLGSDFLIALHDQGKQFDSMSFARQIERLQVESNGKIDLIIGGAFGIDQRILSRAKLVWSLSALTFSHQLVRLVILEQLYRAFSILRGTAYHK